MWLNKWHCQRLPKLYVQEMAHTDKNTIKYTDTVRIKYIVYPISTNVTSPSQPSVP